MVDIRGLLDNMIAAESSGFDQEILAPLLSGGRIRARVAGLVTTWRPEQEDFEGWGVFQPISETHARLVREADYSQVVDYLKLLPRFRLRLAFQLDGPHWIARPRNDSDIFQRLGRTGSFHVHLVQHAARFDAVEAAWDGASMWYVGPDFTDDPMRADDMRKAFLQQTDLHGIRVPGMTPEDHRVVNMADVRATVTNQWMVNYERSFRKPNQRNQTYEQRVQAALATGDGQLIGVIERRHDLLVHWSTGSGEEHRSVVDKRDMTVISSGICLAGRDRHFDLQSLVGVVEDRPSWVDVY